ncbi:unannotated protein [freshwater metagenome]|uniref:Unannotated protein n=1 Tax=freshwater metagenome TaxID=449393 RepID=A0A6J7FH21_9ZZZZ|nr:hypothetical protein [Actinomycetota bacterium]
MSTPTRQAPHPADLLHGPTKVVSFKARVDHLSALAEHAAIRGLGIGEAHREAISQWIGTNEVGDPDPVGAVA